MAARPLYRLYRNTKNRLQHTRSWLSRGFFLVLGWAEALLSENRYRSARRDREWLAQYHARFGTAPRYALETAHPVARDTVDHQLPRGAIRDNSTHPPFNRALYAQLGRSTGVRLLDLGCAGGGFVRSILADGNIAVGLEGSDHPRAQGLGEWRTCPLHLFTCDITRPFTLRETNGALARFEVVTMWEVLEHIPAEQLDALIANIAAHLVPGGLFIASVDQTPDINPLTGAVYHATLQDRAWWTERFLRHPFRVVERHHFRTRDFVRGNGVGLKSWAPELGDGFHLVLERTAD